MKKFPWAAAGLLAAILLVSLVVGYLDGSPGGAPAAGLAAQEPAAPAADPASPSEEGEPEAANGGEPLPLATGPRPRPAAIEGPRAGQRRPALGAKLALVFGDWSQGGWTDLLDEPRAGAARRSQALLGDEVTILDQKEGGAWTQVKLVTQDGLRGWVRTDHLTVGNAEIREAWKQEDKYVVVRAPGVPAEGDVFLPFGAILPRASAAADLRLLLPDGRRVALEPSEVRRLQRPLALAEALEQLRGFREVPFQNGGNTVQAMDAAGLIFLAFRVTGVATPRGLAELRRAGTAVSFDDARAGDVVFYSTFNPDLSRPVLLLDAGKTFIEASPARGVGFGRVEQMRQRTILDVRRYGENAVPSQIASSS